MPLDLYPDRQTEIDIYSLRQQCLVHSPILGIGIRTPLQFYFRPDIKVPPALTILIPLGTSLVISA